MSDDVFLFVGIRIEDGYCVYRTKIRFLIENGKAWESRFKKMHILLVFRSSSANFAP